MGLHTVITTKLYRGAAVLGASILVAGGILVPSASMAAADPATLTGTITIQTSVEDASSPEGFGYEIASANCAIDTTTTASTDAAGVVTFAGLALTNDEGADCT